MDDLYVRLQKALDAGVPSGHFDGCASEHEATGFVCDCQFAEFFRRLIERDQKLLAEYLEGQAALDRRAAAEARFMLGRGELRGSVKDGWAFAGRVNTLRSQVERAAEFWLTDTETTDGRR